MSEKIKYDSKTSAWLKNHIGAETTVAKCSFCGLFYKPIIGHKCKKGGVKRNEKKL